ncbi:unnamed protein product [Bathycoccus prasinos]
MMVLPSSSSSSSFAPLSSSSLNNNNNNNEKKKTKFEFPIAVGKTLRVMDLCGKKIVVRNLDPGDERVEISSFLSSLSSSSSSRNEGGGSGGRLRLKAEKLENGDVYAYTVSDEEEEDNNNNNNNNNNEVVIECKIPPRFVSLDVLMGKKSSLTVDANIAEASVDVTVVDEDDDETDEDGRDDAPSASSSSPPACVQFLKSVKGAYVNVETLNGDVLCETIQANASIKTNGGDVIAKRVVANDLRIDAGTGGNVHIDSVFVHDCELHTKKGEVRSKKNFRASGNTKCITNGGDISLENVECGDEDAEVTIDARSQGSGNGGDISIHFAPRVTNVQVYTNNEGSINARVPSGFPAFVLRREENQPDEVIVPETNKKEANRSFKSFGETTTTRELSQDDKNTKAVSAFGARIVHDTDDVLARKMRAEYESKSSVVFSLGSSASTKSKKLLSLVETSWLDEVLFKQ